MHAASVLIAIAACAVAAGRHVRHSRQPMVIYEEPHFRAATHSVMIDKAVHNTTCEFEFSHNTKGIRMVTCVPPERRKLPACCGGDYECVQLRDKVHVKFDDEMEYEEEYEVDVGCACMHYSYNYAPVNRFSTPD